MIDNAIINFIKGDTCSRDFTISNYEDEINKVLFTIKNNESDKRPLLQKSYEIDLTHNLFDKTNVNKFNASISTQSKELSTASEFKTLYLPCRPNTNYLIKSMNSWNITRIATSENIPTIGCSLLQTAVADEDLENQIVDMNIVTAPNAHYLLIQYYWTRDNLITEEEAIDSIGVYIDANSDGITLVSDEDGVRTYNLLIDANETDNFKVDYEYYFAIKIFTYEESGDIELTPIKGTITLSARGD